MQEYSHLSVLIVDPNPSMRASLHNMLTQSDISKIDYAVSAGTAVRQISKRPFDLILCEYDLGSGADGQDGQQLLEDLRHHKLIGLETIFIMLTSEGVYSKVVSAAELAPTDYILKPFTVDVLSGRIGRAIERRAFFLPTYQLINQGDLRGAIQACADADKNQARYAADFARLRAELHLELGELAQAEHIYQAVLAFRPLGWAHLGLARSLFQQQRYLETREALNRLIDQNPNFMAAYDLLARTHEAMGETEEAKKVLEDAVTISPHMVRRLRHLGEVAYGAEDIRLAERSFKKVLTKSKYSEFRDPEDHLNLVRALARKGDGVQGSAVVRDMERSLRASPNLDACRAMGSALLLDLAGDATGAAAELGIAVDAVATSKGLSARLRMELARNCLTKQLDKDAGEVLQNLMNDGEVEVSMEQVVDLCEKAGRHDFARGMGAQIVQQVQDLMRDAAEKARLGEHRAAVITLNRALRRTPGNPTLLFASVEAILKQLNTLGWEVALAEQCQHQLQTIAKIDPDHMKLAELRELYAATQRKYGIAG